MVGAKNTNHPIHTQTHTIFIYQPTNAFPMVGAENTQSLHLPTYIHHMHTPAHKYPPLWSEPRTPTAPPPYRCTICIHQTTNALLSMGTRTPNTPRPSPYLRQLLLIVMGFPCGSAGKESACSVGDLGCIPGWGRSPWRRERLPTPVFWPGKSHGKRTLVHDRCSGYKDSDKTK